MKYIKEDLMNTWGEVESKEHAEFIVEVADSAGLGVIIEIGAEINELKFFSVTDRGCLYMWTSRVGISVTRKQITIPLPPKNKAEKPDFPKPPKHFDCVCNKCGGKCCIGNCDEWPQVGDRVRWDKNDYSGTVKAVSEGKAWCKLDSGLYHTIGFDRLKKPKSKQDLLIEELHQKLLANNCSDEYLLACDIVQGKVEGLSYE